MRAKHKLRVFNRSKTKCCIYCGEKLTKENFTVEHVFPLALGGGRPNMINREIACRSCNRAKGDMLLTDFIKKYNVKITPEIVRHL
jgi:5-methylcytosine-specific restriction endonuclease McrA